MSRTDDPRRGLPSVGSLLESDDIRPLLARAPRTAVVDAIRTVVESARRSPEQAPREAAEWTRAIADELGSRERAQLGPVINATGVVLHTNLGRAPLARAALEAIRATAAGFSNLEYDLEHGERGSRYDHCRSLIRELTGAEDAIVVNNCAAALVLALDQLAGGREAIVSRGELIEIGGSFRIPDIMAKSGARLVEVGTTNRTHLTDYSGAIGPRTGAIVKVHRSNFVIDGFVTSVETAPLAKLATDHGLPLLHDLGSGLLWPLDSIGLSGEPTAREVIGDGASLVLMSGDKLLGGPQAGLIAGRGDLVAAIAKNPLTRALRVDKLTLAALQATLTLHLDPSVALREVPVLAMLAATTDALSSRARVISQRLRAVGIASAIVETQASVGGGAFPTATLPSVAVAFTDDVVTLEARLRRARLPVIARILDGRLLLDMRSMLPDQDERLIEAVVAAHA
jgi:L-seryl-tRNA(Ser) seleniumtransferase